MISTSIEHSVNQSTLKYRQAAQISESSDEFSHAMRTDLGYTFAYGNFFTEDAVSDDRIDGKHLEIVRTYQKYQMHTRVVHYTTGSGKHRVHRTRLEHYWTWDTYSVERDKATSCKFIGIRLPVSKFNFSSVPYSSKTVSNGHHKRIIFETRPRTFNCTIFSELKDKTISDDTPVYYEKTIPEVYEYETTSHATMIFWIAWSFLMAGAVFAFVAYENDWLEDSDKKEKKSCCGNSDNVIYYSPNTRKRTFRSSFRNY